MALGPALEVAIRTCVERSKAFCVLDQRLSQRQRADELKHLGATAVLESGERVTLHSGQEVDPDIALVMLTSGSTGTPKVAELTWDALRASASLTQATLRHDGAPVWYPCLPANHIGGLAVLLRAILDEATLYWGDGDLTNGPRAGASHIAVVRPQLARFDLSGYATVLLGGARPPSDLGANVVTTWGMTETGSGVVYDGYALPGVEIATLDGELIVRSPTLFRSYRTHERPRVTGHDGRSDWFPTGDVAEIVDSRLSVKGRLGFVINTGGEKLWPEDLESVIAKLHGVRDVAVTSSPDPEWGERVIALIVSDGTRFDDAIRNLAQDEIGPWAKPKEIRYVAALPRTSNGKLRRGDLANLY